jgi:predicted ferric reductase
MTIHKTRSSSMTLSYVLFALTLVWVFAALALIAAGWVDLRFEAWRLVYLLSPLAVIGVTVRLVRAR